MSNLRAAIMKGFKYDVEIDRVREVSLSGWSDLDFWKAHLGPEGLFPLASRGRAELLIIAADARFMGLRFQELSLSVLVTASDGGEDLPGAYLVAAVTSRPFFAFVERKFFQTPYAPGQVQVCTQLPASIVMRSRDGGSFTARMSEEVRRVGREALPNRAEFWEGPVFLPNRRSNRLGRRRLFFARLTGETRTYPFLPQDTLALESSPGNLVARWLSECGFTGHEWVIRDPACHAKSRTLAREAALAAPRPALGYLG